MVITMSGKDSPKQEEPRRHLQIIVLASIAVVSIFIFLSVVTESETLSVQSMGTKFSKSSNTNVKANKICSDVCVQRRNKRSASSNYANLLDYGELIGRLEASKTKLLEKLRTDYGDYFEPIFVDPETGGYRLVIPITKDGMSMDRLKRKLQIKILSMQSKFGAVDSDFHGCDCSTSGNDLAVRADEVLASLDPENSTLVLEDLGDDGSDDGLYEKYVWITGGHSAAAGHGNLYNESYTAYMEADLVDVFGSIGIEFEGRNYAMGGTSSATLVSMCYKEIFGEDADFFSWDYGMTDGNLVARLLHYAYRGALSKTRPGMLTLHYNGRAGPKRLEAMRDLEAMGLAAFIGEDKAENAMRQAFPDSAGIDSSAIDALPEYVRNYRCGDSIEKGDPFCGKKKYTTWGCSPRFKQASWHPGYKDHAMIGHGLALFLMEALISALQELSKNDEVEDASGLLTHLLQEDIDLHNNFTTAELPALHKNLLQTGEAEIDNELFFRGPSMCHTARLPAQTRYRGILTATDQVGEPAPVGKEKYFVGEEIGEAKKSASKDSELRIVYTVFRERETKCVDTVVKPDYPDAWFANAKDGWTKLTFPNDAEKEYYGYDPSEYRGIIILHWKPCDWGKCEKGFLQPTDYANKDWELKINSQQISEVKDIGLGASMVKGEETGFIFEPNENGQYFIELKVNKENHYVAIADFVLY